VALNQDSAEEALIFLIENLSATQGIDIQYPMCFEPGGESFTTYEAGDELLPSIFLIDQDGRIHLRFDGADEPSEFLPELEEIIAKIDDLLGG
jgi:hypothetical protein